MKPWPQDSRPYVVPTAKLRKKASDVNKPVEGRSALHHGSRSAALLTSSGGPGEEHLDWAFAAEPFGKRNNIVQSSLDVKVFPNTVPPTIKETGLTPTKKAERGAHFIRTHYPDVDIPFELLRDELTADRRLLEQSTFDVYAGNRISSSPYSDGSELYGVLAFAMGSNMQDLNIASIFRNELKDIGMASEYVISPSASSVASFKTPIKQVILTQPSQAALAVEKYIVVRTVSDTNLFQLRFDHQSRSSPITVKLRKSLSLADTSGRRQVDVAVAASPDVSALVIDNLGTLYRWSRDRFIAVPRTLGDAQSSDQFWRLALDAVTEQALVASRKVVELMDFRSSALIPLYTLSSRDSCITSIEGLPTNNMICLSSTDHIMYLDRRFTGRFLMSWSHQRTFDRSLQVNTLMVGSVGSTILSSRKSAVASAYDFNLSAGVFQSTAPPYPIHVSPTGTDRAGIAILQSSNVLDSSTIFEMSSRGGIYARSLTLSPSGPSRRSPLKPPVVEWMESVNAMDTKDSDLVEDLGPLGPREKTVVDLRGAFERLFYTPSMSNRTLDHLPSTAATIERMPTIMQETDLPLEHILTTFDLALLSSDEPLESRRADFLTLHNFSMEHNVQWMLEQLRDLNLKKNAPWQSELVLTLERLSARCTMPIECATGLVPLSSLRTRFALNRDNTTEGSEVWLNQYEDQACDRLVLDLALSLSVFFSENPRTPGARSEQSSNFVDLASATSALSLSDSRPPALSFAFLRPRHVPNQTEADAPVADNVSPSDVMEASDGARLLLSEWVLGSDPTSYVYTDPYGLVEPMVSGTASGAQLSAPSNLQSHGILHKSDPITATGVVVPGQDIRAPPRIKPSQRSEIPSTLASRPSSTAIPRIEQAKQSETMSYLLPRAFPSSQGEFSRVDQAVSSQEAFPSTQQLPGPFGDRPEARIAKKKVMKKRLTGF